MPNPPGDASKPVSIEKRLPLALALMMIVLLVSQYVFKPAPGPKPVKPATEKPPAVLVQKPEAPASPQAAPVTGETRAGAEITTDIDTDLYHIVFSNRGGVITSWVLKRFTNDAGKPLQVIDTAATGVPLPFSIQTTGQQLSFDPNTVLYQPRITDGGLGIVYEYSDGKTSIRKSFLFRKDSYLSNVSSVVLENGAPVPSMFMWRGGFGDRAVRNASSLEHTVRYDTNAGKLVTKTLKDAKNGPITDSGNYTFAGLEDSFFAAVALPPDGSSVEVRTYSDDVKQPNEEKPSPYVGVGLSTGAENNFSLFVGPKDINVLKQVNPKLTQIIDWGFFGVIAKPLFLWLNWIKDHWTGNYGWAIILVTLLINLALFPLRLTSLKSARKMQKLQPQIQAINAKYKNLSCVTQRRRSRTRK